MSFGQSKSNSSQDSSQTVNPYAPTIPDLSSFLGQLRQNSSATPPAAETSAIEQLIGQAGQGNPFASGVAGVTQGQLNASTQPQQTTVGDAYRTFQTNTAPVATGQNQDFTNNPQLQAQLSQIQQDVSNNVNSQFAGAGRYGSGADQNAVARGIAAGEAPVLLNELNTQQARTDAANRDLLSGGQTTATTQAGLIGDQAAINSQGINNEPAALTAQQWGPTQVAALSQQLTQLPLDKLDQVAALLFPAAQLGRQSTGTQSGSSKTTSFGFTL